MSVDKLKEIQDALGPKIVKTPTLEIQQHSLQDLLAAQKLQTTIKPTLGNMLWSTVRPKYPVCGCGEDERENGCGG